MCCKDTLSSSLKQDISVGFDVMVFTVDEKSCYHDENMCHKVSLRYEGLRCFNTRFDFLPSAIRWWNVSFYTVSSKLKITFGSSIIFVILNAKV